MSVRVFSFDVEEKENVLRTLHKKQHKNDI